MKKLRRLGLLLLLCICGAALMKTLSADRGDGGAGTDRGEETIVGWVIEGVSDGTIDLSDEDSIRRAVAEGEERFGISLTEENEDRIVGFAQTLDTVEAGADDFIGQAEQMYEKYCAEFVEQANDKINGAFRDAAEGAAHGFVDGLFSTEDE